MKSGVRRDNTSNERSEPDIPLLYASQFRARGAKGILVENLEEFFSTWLWNFSSLFFCCF